MPYYSSGSSDSSDDEEFFCDRCDRYFVNDNALQNHLDNSSSHNTCDDCNLDFATNMGLIQHYVQSPKHPYCQRCDRHFSTHAGSKAHFVAAHWYCAQCNKFFESEGGLEQHLEKASAHQRQVAAPRHHCSECNKDFNSQSNLREHMESKIHRSKDVSCPFKGCGQHFVKASALILHLESGACPSRVDRARIDRFVRQLDKHNLITKPSGLVTWDGTRYDDTTSVTYTATSKCFNGSGYECYLCHREFQTLPALNQHLSSPKHQDEQYICPLASCRVNFRTLSGFCQHVESQRCGVSRFRAVQNAIDNVVNGGRLLLRS